MKNKSNVSLMIKVLILNVMCILIAIISAFEVGLLKHKMYSELKCNLKITNCSSESNNTKTELKPVDSSSSNIRATNITPIRVKYDSLGIDLEIVSHSFDQNIRSWVVDKNRANIMNEQAKLFPPNNQGQTFIYGHNTNNVFYFVNLLNNGDIVNLFDAQNNQYSFRVYDLETLPPTRSDILDYSGEYRLALMTCTSFNDVNRKIVYLKPV